MLHWVWRLERRPPEVPSSLGCCEEGNTEMDQSPSCSYLTNLTGKQQTSTASKEHMKTPTTELLAPQENLSSFSSKQMLVSVASLATSLLQRISAMTNTYYAGRIPQQRDFLVPPSLEYCVALEHSSYFSNNNRKTVSSTEGRKKWNPPPKYRNNKFRQEITRYPSSAILANPTASSSVGH